MTDIVDNVESEFVNWAFNNTDVRASSTEVVVSLHTSDPGESPDGSTELDNSTLSYERVVTTAGTGWNITEPDTAANANEISFPTATEDWPAVSHYVLWDGDDGTENALFSDELHDSNGDPVTKTATTDDTIAFDAGSLTATFD